MKIVGLLLFYVLLDTRASFLLARECAAGIIIVCIETLRASIQFGRVHPIWTIVLASLTKSGSEVHYGLYDCIVLELYCA